MYFRVRVRLRIMHQIKTFTLVCKLTLHFHFQKITGKLKKYYFLYANFQRPSLYIKEQSTKIRFEKTVFNILFNFPKMGKTVFTSVQGQNKHFS